MNFNELKLHPLILRAIAEDGYETPTPIQARAIPALMGGHDLLGSAQTGTGKTAAFALPMINTLAKMPNKGRGKVISGLVLAPTRELALQIKENFDRYDRKTHVKAIAIYGGTSKHNQIVKIKRGVDVLIATPGRLLDLMQMRVVKLDHVQMAVLDEADQMLDMGFIDDVKKIMAALPKERQTMLFSATIPKAIAQLANSLLKNPVRIEVAPQNQPLDTIKQEVFMVKREDKKALLTDLLKPDRFSSALIFARTKRGADHLAHYLARKGYKSGAYHGDKTQRERERVLGAFKAKRMNVLIATDVAARGIDIDALSHVINYDMPETKETYMHRIGRTARAGALGQALSLCSPEERHLLSAIQKHIGFKLPLNLEHAYLIPANKNRSDKPSYNGRNKKGYQATSKNKNKKAYHRSFKQQAHKYA